MPTTPIPAQVQILVDSDDFPTITGDSAYETWLDLPGNSGLTEQDFIDSLKGEPGAPGSGGGGVEGFASIAPGFNTSSSTFVTTGLTVTVPAGSATDNHLITVSGFAGNSGSANINRFAIFRKIGSGSFTDLTVSGDTGMAGTRTVDNGYCDPFTIQHKDEPNTTDAVTYELFMNVAAGTGYLGQRPDGTVMKYRTTMKVEKA